MLSVVDRGWIGLGRAKKITKRARFIIRQSRPIPIRDADADFELRQSRPIPVREEGADFTLRVSCRIAISEEETDCIWGR